MTRLNFNAPEKLALEFKVRCVREGRQMTDVLVELMKEYLKRPLEKKETAD